MADLIKVSKGVFKNHDHFYESRSLMNSVLDEITDKLYKAGVPQDSLPRPNLKGVEMPREERVRYLRKTQEIQVNKLDFLCLEQKIKEDEKSARDEIEFVLGHYYGWHIFNVFTGFQGSNELNQDLYGEFADIFSNWFRDTMYNSNPHVLERKKKEDFGIMTPLTNFRLNKKFEEEGYFELFKSLKNYFFEIYLKDTKPSKRPLKKSPS